MADILSEIQWLPPLINAVLTLFAASFVFARYRLNKLRQFLFWGLGLIVLSTWFFTEFSLHSSLIVRTSFTTLFAATPLSIFLVLFYYGCAITLTMRRIYTIFLPSIVFIAEQSLFIYLGFLVGQLTLAASIDIFILCALLRVLRDHFFD